MFFLLLRNIIITYGLDLVYVIWKRHIINTAYVCRLIAVMNIIS